MEAINRNLLQSGIEPVDKILGGLEPHQLYLAYGDGAGKSLFGFKFLIEGLKRGEAGAMIIRYSPEDAVRRFARLGYDCLEDVRQHRLVILEYDDDMVQQIARLQELTPVLRELAWWLWEATPRRIIFDPVMPLIVGNDANLQTRVQEFTHWAASFDATVLMIGNGEYKESLHELQPFVRESFRFDVRENGNTVTRYFTFEKTPELKEQAIEVDPLRGVFLLHRTTEELTSPFALASPEEKNLPAGEEATVLLPSVAAEATSPLQNIFSPVEIDEDRNQIPPAANGESVELGASNSHTSSRQSSSVVAFPQRAIKDSSPISSSSQESQAAETTFISVELESSHQQPHQMISEPVAHEFAGVSDFLQEIEEAMDAIHLDEELFHSTDDINKAQPRQSEPPVPEIQPVRVAEEKPVAYGRRFGDRRNRPEAVEREQRGITTVETRRETPPSQPTINPKDFHILVIEEDALLCERIGRSMTAYSVTTIQDALQGLAIAMSLNPDLVILDMDIPMMDGFKVLAQIRSCINVPIITLSESRLRASDRILSAELGADYYLTKPLRVVELKQKVRQLIARYRGINTWISSSSVLQNTLEVIRHERESQRYGSTKRGSEPGKEQLTSYEQFNDEVETRVKTAIERGASFSVVGFNLNNLQRQTHTPVIEIFYLVSRMIRSDDLLTRNPRNELVALLADTDSNGAKAFINRLRQKLSKYVNRELPIWVRSFPSLEEGIETVSKEAPVAR